MVEKEVVVDRPELDDETKADVVKAIEASLNGEPITNRQAVLLLYWARHQDDKAFDFVPKQYRLNVEPTAVKKKKTGVRK